MDGNETVDRSDADGPERSDDPTGTADDSSDGDASMPGVPDPDPQESGVPDDVRKYARFKKMDGAQYDRVNEFLRDRTYITAREWAIARLCSDFRTETGVEMTKIGENLPDLVPFMTDTYSPQAVNQARSSFEDKVRTAGATFLYGAMCDFFTAEELDDVMYEPPKSPSSYSRSRASTSRSRTNSRLKNASRVSCARFARPARSCARRTSPRARRRRRVTANGNMAVVSRHRHDRLS